MAALFAAPQLGIQSMFSTMLRMMEEQQKELAKARAETQQLRDEVEIMEPRLDGLDNQVDSIKEQVKTLEFNLSADEDEAPPPAPAPDPMLERMAALEARQQEKEAELQKLREEKNESERLARESEKQAREASQEAQMNLEKEKIKAQAELDRVKLELESKAELAREEAQRAVEEAEKERAAAAGKSEAEAAAAEAKLEAAKIAAGAEAAQLRVQADAALAEAKRAAEQAEADAKQQAAEAAAQAEAAKAAEALAEAEAKAAADKADAEAKTAAEKAAAEKAAAEKAAAEKAAAEKAAAEAAAAEKPNAEVFKPGGLLRSKMKKNATGIAFIAKVKRQSTITNMASERVLDPKMKLGYRIEQLEEKIVVVEKMKANLEKQREDFDKLRECGDESFMNSIRFMIQDEVQKEMGAASLRNDDEKASAMQDQVERQKMMNQQLDELAEKFEKDAVAKISELRVALDVKMNRDEFTNAFKDFDEDGGKDAVGGNDAIAEGDESSPDGEGSASQPMGLRLVQKFSRLGSQIAELETKNRSSIETATRLAKDISETGDYMHNVLPELQSADEDLRKLCADAEMRATHAEEQVGGASGATKKLTESMNELKNRELAAEEKLGITGAMAESHDKELQKLARSLEGKPSENAVQGIVEALIEEASIGKGAGGGSSEMIAMMVENLRLDLRNKTSRSDVLRLTAAIVEQMSSQLQPSDTLMAGTVPLRCISCGQHTKGSMHKDVAEKVVHDGLNPNGQPGGQQQVNGSVKQMHKKPHNQLVMATYPNGRAGALRPLQPQGMPQHNLSATGTRHQGAPGNARGR